MNLVLQEQSYQGPIMKKQQLFFDFVKFANLLACIVVVAVKFSWTYCKVFVFMVCVGYVLRLDKVLEEFLKKVTKNNVT